MSECLLCVALCFGVDIDHFGVSATNLSDTFSLCPIGIGRNESGNVHFIVNIIVVITVVIAIGLLLDSYGISFCLNRERMELIDFGLRIESPFAMERAEMAP